MAEHDLPICQDTPEILQFVRVSIGKSWNTFEAPHSGGRVPEKLLLASSKSTKSESVPLEPQVVSRLPFRKDPPSLREDRAGKLPASPHADGIVPTQVGICSGVLYLRKWASVLVFAAACGTYSGSDIRVCL